MLYDTELLRELTTLYQILRYYLVLKGFQYEMAPGSNRLIRGLAHCFFTEDEDKQHAVSCLNNLLQHISSHTSASTNTGAQPIIVIQQQPNPFDEEKAEHNNYQRFKKEETFTGKLGGNINHCLANYEEACAD